MCADEQVAPKLEEIWRATRTLLVAQFASKAALTEDQLDNILLMYKCWATQCAHVTTTAALSSMLQGQTVDMDSTLMNMLDWSRASVPALTELSAPLGCFALQLLAVKLLVIADTLDILPVHMTTLLLQVVSSDIEAITTSLSEGELSPVVTDSAVRKGMIVCDRLCQLSSKLKVSTAPHPLAVMLAAISAFLSAATNSVRAEEVELYSMYQRCLKIFGGPKKTTPQVQTGNQAEDVENAFPKTIHAAAATAAPVKNPRNKRADA